jgi:hypothetical protein
MPAAALSVPLRALPLVAFKCPNAQICVLWPLQLYLSVHKYVYFGHFNLTFQCTNMCTLDTSTLPFSAKMCVLWTLQLYLSVHKYVYFGHFNLNFQCTNMCTLGTSTLPFSAQICVLWPLQPYLSVNKYVYFGHFNLTFQCTNMCTLDTSTLHFSAQMCVLRPLKVNEVQGNRMGSFEGEAVFQDFKKLHPEDSLPTEQRPTNGSYSAPLCSGSCS